MKQEFYKMMDEVEVYSEMTDSDKSKLPVLMESMLRFFKLTVMEKTRKELQPQRGDIWTVDLLENVGSELNKIRPCLVVQNDTGNKFAPTTIIVPISTKDARQPTQYQLSDDDFYFNESVTVGVLACEQVRVVSKARLVKKVAKIKYDKMSQIDSVLKISLGIR